MSASAPCPLGPSDFRTLLGQFPTGVAVVGVQDTASALRGFTASSLTAVSLNPPLVSVCVDRAASIHTHLTAAKRFGVTVLADDQQHLAEHFAGPDVTPFNSVPHRVNVEGVPVLEGGAAQIVCEMVTQVEAGDHTIVMGLVVGGEAFDRAPLVHHRGQYRKVRLPHGTSR